MGVKGGRCIGLTVFESGSLKFLKPSGPVQAYNGIAFTSKIKPCFIVAYSENIVYFQIFADLLSELDNIKNFKFFTIS